MLAVHRKLVVPLLKYGIGLGLLALVVWLNWHPRYEARAQHLSVLEAVPIQAFPAGAPWSAVLSSGQEEWLQPSHPGLSGALGSRIHVVPLFLAVMISAAAVSLTFVRWFILVRAQGLPFTLRNAMRLGLVGYFFNTFLPGAVGGDIIKAACIAREQSRRTVAVATVLLDRAIGFCGLIWLCAALGGIFWWSDALHSLTGSTRAVLLLESILLAAWLLVAGSVAFWIVLGVLSSARAEKIAAGLERIPKIGMSIAEFWRAVWMVRLRGRSVVVALVLAMVGHAGFIFTYYFASQTLNSVEQMPSLTMHFLLVPVGMTIQAGIPTPGGVGGAEAGYGLLYQSLGFAAAAGILGSLVQRAISWIVGLTGYLVYLQIRPQLPVLAAETVRQNIDN